MWRYIDQNADKISRWYSWLVMGLSVLGALAYVIFTSIGLWNIIQLAWWWKLLILLVAIPVLFVLVAGLILIALLFITMVVLLASCIFRTASKIKGASKVKPAQPGNNEAPIKEE